MGKTVQENLGIVLKALYEIPREKSDRYEIGGPRIAELTNLSPEEINDAVEILEMNGYVEWLRYSGTVPYIFGSVNITAAGRFEYERALKEAKTKEENVSPVSTHQNIIPIGSPYGFADEDWEIVSLRKGQADKLNVVFGFQFSSEYYESKLLVENIKEDFIKAVDDYNNIPTAVKTELNFVPLGAGYGEHLFNEIARDIISADIAVFDTSNLNPNVMLEMGVALTWGIRVLPIKKEGCDKPPSDISGHTWADYINNGAEFIDSEHSQKLMRMVERAARKKSK